ncbi:hypothetical protein EUX98_g689 [Antrodiella citrinella]|uniref:AMP-dependent synthetase/ligase domain-containing protein n=1 Tax=Antrodiella citrinella TaxID=2447956 RepID=A0A4S4N3D3_9APHY|nr:hypothetical protein EUX98_g689 [Antrodiella citrinella]
MVFAAPIGPPDVPDNLTIPQFLLDSRHPLRPLNQQANPWFIQDEYGRGVGFEEVRARTYGLANAMSSRYNIHYPTALWAIHRLGAVATCANPAYQADELKYQIDLAGATLMFTHSENLVIATQAARACNFPADRIIILDSPNVPAFDSHFNIERLVLEGLAQPPQFTERKLSPGEGRTKLALLSFSSGTTGRPKAVAIPHYALIANVVQMALHVKANEEHVPRDERRYRTGDGIYAGRLASIPYACFVLLCERRLIMITDIYGAVVILHFYLFAGYTLVIPERFNFVQMLKSIERYRINHLCLVPPMIVLLCKNPATKQHDLSSVRFIMSGAAPLSGELTEQLAKILPNTAIAQAYGMTESCTTLTFPRLDQKLGTLGSSGVLLPGVTAKVIKEDGTPAGFDEPGELYVKAPSLTLGYYKNEAATKETFIDGWLRTGDEVVINRNFEVFVIDRRKEIFKVRGFQVAPAELEGHLLNHPDVVDTCVVGIADDYSGEVPLAFVVLHPAVLARIVKDPLEADKVKAGLIRFVADSKVHYKRLAGGVEFIDAIPKNPSGKLLRRFMREKAKELKKTPNLSVRPKL